MLSKNFDSYRSLQQRFCIHIEDLKFFDISVYFHKQRYYQLFWKHFIGTKKLNWIVMSSTFSSQTPMQPFKQTLPLNSPITSYSLSVRSTAPFPLPERCPRPLLTGKTHEPHTPPSPVPSLLLHPLSSYIQFTKYMPKNIFQNNFFLYLDSILLKTRTSTRRTACR